MGNNIFQNILPELIIADIDNGDFDQLTFEDMRSYIVRNKLCKQFIDRIPNLTNDEKEYLHLL